LPNGIRIQKFNYGTYWPQLLRKPEINHKEIAMNERIADDVFQEAFKNFFAIKRTTTEDAPLQCTAENQDEAPETSNCNSLTVGAGVKMIHTKHLSRR
jgi:hypothetical protein